ncbi:hypothetical protein A7982_13914 [Minicystis rosea]|nr:hypothetical protein A7982_13914 [Minicystis rosea]
MDLTGVSGLDLRMAAANAGGAFSVRIDGSTGTEIGRCTVSTAPAAGARGRPARWR